MRIAVIGGGLLGCASAADLALVEEIDKLRGRGDAENEVTLFCKEAELGGDDFRSVSGDGVEVEVGRYRTLPKVAGSYLADLMQLADGASNCVSILGRRIRIPGEMRMMRGKRGAAPIETPFNAGTYGRLIRSAAVWDFANDKYARVHKGWPLFDLVYRVLNNEAWRAVAVGGLMWALRRLSKIDGMLQRGFGLINVVIMLAIVVLTPAKLVLMWQRTYSFWGTTLPQLMEHGMTAGIARGSVEGFVKAMADNNTKNRATCAPSLDALLARTGLVAYVRGSGNDYTTKFKYDAKYVERYIAPHVNCDYAPALFENVNSLACQLSLYDADYSNSDACSRISRVTPNNKSLCDALLEATRASTPVKLETSTKIARIDYDSSSCEYTLTTASGKKHVFDGVLLAECPEPGTLQLDSFDEDLLAYNAKEANVPGNATHIAVVDGSADPAFFRFSDERHIPDVVTVTGSEHFARVERIREKLYTVVCCERFVADGVAGEMFQDGFSVVALHPRPVNRYSMTPVDPETKVDDAYPPIVLGNRFVFAAAARAVAIHPEFDALMALNAASLFSRAVAWETAKKDNGAEDEEDVGEDDADEITGADKQD